MSRALEELGYSKQVNLKMLQTGNQHVNQDVLFQYINTKAQESLDANEPVIFTDTKKKELVGNFKNNGAKYRSVGEARKVLDHDFLLTRLGKVTHMGYTLSIATLGSPLKR